MDGDVQPSVAGGDFDFQRVHTFWNLPFEIVLLIFADLDARSLLNVSQVSRLWSAYAKDPSLWKHVKLICQKGVFIQSQLNTLCQQTPVGSGSLTWLTLKGTDVEADIFQRGFEPPVTDCLTNLLRLDFDNHFFPHFSWLAAFAPSSPLLKHVTFTYCSYDMDNEISAENVWLLHVPELPVVLANLKYFRLTAVMYPDKCACIDGGVKTSSWRYLVHGSKYTEFWNRTRLKVPEI